MFNCDVRLDITLSSKQMSSASQDFKVVVGVRISGDESGGVWRQLGTPDTQGGTPTDGQWQPVPTGVILKSGRERTGNAQNFAFLRTMGIPPQAGATGEINVFTPGQRDYSSPNLAWRGKGNFEVLARNLNLPVTPSGTWALMKRNMWDTVGQGLGWELTTTGGVSFSGGAGGRGIEVIPRGTLYIKRMTKPYETRSFSYVGAGAGFMIPGAGGSYSDPMWPSIGTEITKGNMPISDPLRLEDLEGACHIVDISLGGILPTPIPGGRLPIGLGAAGNALGIIFGVPGGLAIGGFKACGWVAGPVALAGKAGASAGAVLNIGLMRLNK